MVGFEATVTANQTATFTTTLSPKLKKNGTYENPINIYTRTFDIGLLHEAGPMEALIDRVFTVAEQQYTAMDTRLTEKTLPRTLSADGEFVPSNIYWWCSGFYPGSLWYIYEYTGNEAVKTLAEKNTLKLDSIQYVTRDHDVGFQLNCSYGNAFRLTGNEAYKQVLYQAPSPCQPASILLPV